MNEDIELIDRVIKGDINAYSLLMERYERGVLKFIYNLIKNKETTEDISQEVFITVYYKLHTYKRDYKFSTWLYRIAINKCVDYMRKNKNRSAVEIEDLSLPSREESPEYLLELKETKKDIESFIKALSDIDRKILALRCAEDKLTFKDIAEVLNMSESNVKKRYYKVQERYERYIYESFKLLNKEAAR